MARACSYTPTYLVEAFGGLDYAFNCAATAGEMTLTADCTEANWDRTVLTSLTGV